MDKFMQAGKFKAECLKVMEEVRSTGKEIVVTKHRVPIVKMCPIDKPKKTLFGKMAGTIHVKKDIISPIEEEWNANS